MPFHGNIKRSVRIFTLIAIIPYRRQTICQKENKPMIRFIKGIVADIEENFLILENHGIGYRIFTPASVLERYVRVGEEIKLHTYMNVREDAMLLYGFLTADDLRLFELLLGVSGIGPKAGLGILSALSADDLRFAVLSDDAAAIAKAPGIGKKTAQKLILELKDKMSLEDAFEKKLAHEQETPAMAGADETSEAVMALTALGYASTDALRAVRAVEGHETMDVEALLKAALKNLL